MAALSLEEKCAQLLVARPVGDAFDPRDAAAEIGVGGYIVHAGMTNDPERMAAWIEDAQAHAQARTGIPLLVCADHEGGQVRILRGRATDVPPNMGLGAAGDPAGAREAAAILGAELRIVGVNWVLAPVVDVNNNPANPVIGVRSYGDDPVTVGAFAREAVAGFQGEGILACAKHFPGHGDTDRDSHVTLPTIRHDRARLDRIELPPFREAIAAGVATIMPAPLALPALDPGHRHASHATLTGLLRGETGFGRDRHRRHEMRGLRTSRAGDAAVAPSPRARTWSSRTGTPTCCARRTRARRRGAWRSAARLTTPPAVRSRQRPPADAARSRETPRSARPPIARERTRSRAEASPSFATIRARCHCAASARSLVTARSERPRR